MAKPAGWKNYEDFAAGIDTNRLPTTGALAGRSCSLAFDRYKLQLDFKSATNVQWSQDGQGGADTYEALVVAPDTYFIDMTFAAKPREALTIILNTASRRTLAIRCIVADSRVEGTPQVSQQFDIGALSSDSAPTGMKPEPTRDLIGTRTFQRYSPRHLYEHTYLNSERYCWQCLVGEQRGHGDVDLASYYKFAPDQYVFTFREFLIPVASVFFFNMADLRSTGKFLGLTADGAVQNRKAGAFIKKASVTQYEPGTEPA
jgi:hypothetical protein